MQAIHQEILPASGVQFATCLKLLPTTLLSRDLLPTSDPSGLLAFSRRSLFNVVVARSNVLRIFEVVEELAPMDTQREEERERKAAVRKGTEAVEGEVEMDTDGEGFINLGQIKSTTQIEALGPPMVTRLYLVREHRLHGIVTGLETVRVMSSIEDNLDRLLVSFKDAKIALLEWSVPIHDLLTVSIHTYERAPQMITLDSALFRAELRVDPLSRCAALMLPQASAAVLPFYQTQAELEIMEQDQSQLRDVPYSPSFILDFGAEVDSRIQHVIEFAFLPGFNNPTMAILFQSPQTNTGRLKEHKDTVKLFIITADFITHNYPIVTEVEGLPYDCFSIIPCSTFPGGVIILSTNAIIHVGQSSRKVVLPVNGWFARASDVQTASMAPEEAARDLQLEGSHVSFIDDTNFLVILADGVVIPVEIVAEGKTVSGLKMGAPQAQTTLPSTVAKGPDGYIFVGSTSGPSVLVKADRLEEEVPEGVGDEPVGVVNSAATMDVDDDDDIYGPSTIDPEPTSKGVVISKKRLVTKFTHCDTILAHGPISSMTFSLARNGEKLVPELVTATRSCHLGGFTLFQRDLPTRVKRKVHVVGGGRGMWAFPIRQSVKVNGVSYDRPSNPFRSENDSLIISTDANPSPGLSRIAARSQKGDITITTRMPGTTIGAGPIFQGTAILHVMSGTIRVLEPDGTERQSIKDTDSNNNPRAKIRACSICDPYVLIVREDDTIGLFIETERGKMRRKDMSPMGEKTSRYLAGCFFNDTSGVFQTRQNSKVVSNGSSKTSTLTNVTSGGTTQWLILCRPQGIIEIWTLPKLTLVFSTTALSTLQNVCNDSYEGPAPSASQDRKPSDTDVESILVAPLGESYHKPHFFAWLRSGQFAIYEILPASIPDDPMTPTRPVLLLVKFVKVASRAFDIQSSDETEKSILAEQKKISRQLIPFFTSPRRGANYSGVFLTGDRPSWILSTDKGGIRVIPSGYSVVHAFTACSIWESKGDFLLYSEEGPSLVEWMPDVLLEEHLPSRSVPRSRPYSNVVFEPSTALVVAASTLQAKFASFDEDGNRLWEPDANNVSFPTTECSALELIQPDAWSTMDGYEFAPNEFVNALEIVTLETSSTESGTKDFIAVGTTINRGEDLAVKGATYIFEVVEVVPDPNSRSKRWYKLRLDCRDDAKGPVTAVCGMNGYLVSSMGQKIFVRAFDQDERLVGVAFLDVGVYVASLRTVKNLLVVSDIVKSVWFVAFQEDPYKLSILGKDPHPRALTCADFFFANGLLSILTCDEEGVIRIFDYNPHDPESKMGQHLLCRSEFHARVEYRSSLTVARRTRTGDPDIPQARIICGASNGALLSLTPIDEVSGKRLQLLQGQLTRNVQHVAALNPKAQRTVRNDHVWKPLSKGILDGNMLRVFEELPLSGQNDITRQIGTDRATVLRDWVSLEASW